MADAGSVGLRFAEIGADGDFDEYDRLVRREMAEGDFVAGDELRARTADGAARSWYAYDRGERVGWCAVKIPSSCQPAPDAVHLLGNVVFGAGKGRGYGGAMVAWRASMFAERPLTASVRPGNLASERALAGGGFRRGLPEGPWLVWHRPAPRTTVLVLIDGAAGGQAQGEPLDRIVSRLRGGGDHVEVWDGPPRPIRPGHAALWPDPAAFTAVLRVSMPR